MITVRPKEVKNLDLNIKGIKNITLKGIYGNELRIFGTDVKTDDSGRRSTDVDFKGNSDSIEIEVPVSMYNDIEICCTDAAIFLDGIRCNSIEIDSNDELDITVKDHAGDIMLTQFNASSVLKIDTDINIRTAAKGKDTRIDLNAIDSDDTAPNLIELYGRKSILTVIGI